MSGVAGQLTRLETEVSKSAGTWSTIGGGTLAAEVDETFSDGTTTEFGSPTTVATHTAILAFGANWNGSALGRPYDNTSAVLEVHLRYATGLVVQNIYLVEDVAGNGYATVRDTWTGLFSTMLSTYQRFRRAIASSVVDAIVDFTKLGIKFEIQVANSGRSGLCTYAHLEMGGTSVAVPGSYTEDFTGASSMTRGWTLHAGASLVLVTPPTVGSNEVKPTDAGSLLQIFRSHHVYLPADAYAELTTGTYTTAECKITPFIRHKRGFTGATDQLRYNVVPNGPGAPAQYEYKRDGGPSSPILVTAAMGTYPDLVTNDLLQTRAISDTYSGRKNGVEMMTVTGDADGNLPEGPAGFVLVPFAGVNSGIKKIVMSSTTAPATSSSYAARRRRRGLVVL